MRLRPQTRSRTGSFFSIRFTTVAVLVVLAHTIVVGTELFGKFTTTAITDVTQIAAPVSAGLLCLRAGRRGEASWARAWRFLGWGVLCWALGQMVWSWYELVLGQEMPFPSLADAGYLLFIPLATAAMLSVPGAPDRAVSRLRAVTDAVLVGTSILYVSWVAVLDTIVAEGEGTRFAFALALAYPLGDALVIAIVVTTLVRSAPRHRSTLASIAVGLVLLGLADSSFVYLSQLGDLPAGGVADLFWVAGFAVLAVVASGTASAHQDEEAIHDRTSLLVLNLPFVAVGLVILVSLAQIPGSDGAPDAVGVAMSILITLLLVVRQILVVQENVQLNQRLASKIELLAAQEVELRHQAFHDGLTGLANRSLFLDRLDHSLRRGREPRQPLAVVFLDLDDFKAVNDTFGHDAGDQLLVAVGHRLVGALRPGDTVARLGGDEFGFLLDGITVETVLGIAARISDVFTSPFIANGRAFDVSATFGIALSHPADCTAEELLANADVALYAAKDTGKGDFAVFQDRMRAALVERVGLKADLGPALDHGEITALFQPVVDLATGEVAGAEVSIRWDHHEHGRIPPSTFLPLAEEAGLIDTLDERLLAQAFVAIHLWDSEGLLPSALPVFVKLSASGLRDGRLARRVPEMVAAAGLVPDRLVVEVAEAALVADLARSRAALSALRATGVRMALDDFGVGRSSLHSLRQLPLDVLKIDRSFIRAIGSEPGQAAIVRAVVQLCRELGIAAIAEGIETPEQLDMVRDLGCVLGQGSVFGPQGGPEVLTTVAGASTGVSSGLAVSRSAAIG